MAHIAIPWLPEGCEFPLDETTALENSGRLAFDKKDTASDSGGYGEVFSGTYTDDTGIVHRMYAKRDTFLMMVDLCATKGYQPMDGGEMETFYKRVRNDLTAAWRLLGDPRVVNYLAITTTTRQVASGTVVLPEYFIMEEEGENLHKWLEQHPPCAENRAAFEGYVRCILQGLAALHSAGITHRDVKPKNVVICRHDSSMAKIIDLGLAKPEVDFRDKAVNSMTGATPWFMAPEFMDPQRASQAVDVWAVGVMCAEWLLAEQMGWKESSTLLDGLWNGPNGEVAVHTRLREAVAASISPESLLEQVASAALQQYAAARPSSIDLSATAAAATISIEAKRASFNLWLGQVRHVLHDCVGGVADDADRRLITSFLSRSESMRDVPTTVEELTAIVRALTFDRQRNQLLLRVARNIVQFLLEYSTTPEPDPVLLRYLAKVYVDSSGTLNTVRAVAVLDRAIDITVAARGEDHIDTAALLHQKAAALVKMGGTANLAAAMSLLDCVIKIQTAAGGSDHPWTAVTLHTKAKALMQMGGSANLAAAVALYDRVIDIQTAALGSDHPETAVTLHDKAHALVRMGGSAHLTAAVALYDRVINIKKGTLRADHPSTAATLHEKANALMQMGGSVNLATAVALYDRVIEIATAALGVDHPETAAALHRKAIALVQLGGSANLAAAVALYDRVIDINTAALGSDRLSTAVTLHEKAYALVQMGGTANLAAAVALYDRVIEIKTAALGADHPSTATTLQAKANALVRMGGSDNLAAAVALYDHVIEIATATLGADHPETAAALHQKANALVLMGGSANLAAAVALYDRVMEIRTAALESDHPSTAVTLHQKANALVLMGGSANLAAAVALYDRVVDINTAARGSDHLSTAAPLHGKANALVEMGGSANLAAAIALYDRAIEIRTAALGSDHPETVLARRDKANALVNADCSGTAVTSCARISLGY
jgi:serine/threonine protein kinase